ncbi:MAG: exopolyphosphatase, partial [Pigmentiphaga sp.]|nr:exopolyphosphatase [Pigmentiphaga sp.]
MKNLIAAIDLGSNSFRLVIGRVVRNEGSSQVYQIDRLKETVRLAAGLQEDKTLDEETIERAINVLKRFGERLRSFSPERVRAVATNTFRVASNAQRVLELAEQALGFPIEVIAGREEARLIFSGVTHSLPLSDDRRLVIDIGGGSTEFVIGQHFQPQLLESLPMGCVSYSQHFFPGGRIDAKSMKAAELAARGELEAIAEKYRDTGWEAAFGSSGTAKALCAILTASGTTQHRITLDGMQALKAKLIKVGSVEKADLPDIKADRVAVLPGGLAIMLAAFQELGITEMQTADGALRVGVMFDLLGRDAPDDMRAVTV